MFSPLGDAQTLHYNRGTAATSSSSARKAMLACVIVMAPCNDARRLSHEGSTAPRVRHENRLAWGTVGYDASRARITSRLCETTWRYWRVPAVAGRPMQGAERSLAVSVAPDPSWLPPRSLGKRRLFFGRIASGGVWSSQENGAL
jgi:hypothetical protein